MDQCCNKWKNLLRAYKRFADNAKTSGAAAIRKPAYFDEIQEVVRGNHAINIRCTFDSGRPSISQERQENQDARAFHPGVASTSQDQPPHEPASHPDDSSLTEPSDGPDDSARGPGAIGKGGNTSRRGRRDARRLTPSSHHTQMQSLLKASIEISKEKLQKMKEDGEKKEQFRERLLKELIRHHRAIERSLENNSKKKKFDTSDDSA